MVFVPFNATFSTPSEKYDVVVVYGADPTGVRDSTANFQAAITAAVNLGNVGGSGEVIVPVGVYNINTANLSITGPFKMRGLGSGISQATGGTNVGPAVILNCNGGTGGTQSMFNFPYQGYLWGGLELEDISINYTGTGNIFNVLNLNGMTMKNMSMTLTQAGSMAMFTSGNNTLLNLTVYNCYFTTTATARTNPIVSLSSSIPTGVSECTWNRCGFTNAGLDNSQYMVFYSNTAAGNGFHTQDNFKDCFFEHPFGGCIKSMSGQNINIEGAQVYDIYPALGQSVGNSLFYFGAASGNSGSQGVRITGYSRSLNGTNLDGIHTWDVYCEATTSQVYIEGACVRPASSSIQTNIFFNFNGCNDVAMVNNLSPQGSTINGNSQIAVTNPSPTQSSLYFGTLSGAYASNSWTPADQGFVSWTYDPDSGPTLGGSLLATSGLLYLNGVWIRNSAATLGHIAYYVSIAGATLTAGQSFVGLYNSAGTQIGLSADQSTNWTSTGYLATAISPSSAGSLTLVPTGLYWVAFLSNWTGTAPGFGRQANLNVTLANGPIAAATARYATNTGGTSLPASFTPSANTLTQVTYWAAVY
jgi:hypothetical protein